ncbi:MAG: MarR family transcriptional regulator [Anaerosomatales bacterium]|nr:MarR family transcriptional regulator [Anaerosomatales bacterium]
MVADLHDAHCCGDLDDVGQDADALSGSGSGVLPAFRTFRRVLNLYRQNAFRAFSDLGMHPGQAACLFALRGRDGVSQRELAARMHVSPPTVTGMLQKMEHAGLIERQPDPLDQRLMRIRLTPEGAAMAERLTGLFAKQAEAMFAGLSEHELAQMRRALDRVADNLEQAIGGRPGAAHDGVDGQE